MGHVNLLLSLPQGTIVATNLTVEGFARHRSPGSGELFQARAIYFDLAVANGAPAFKFFDEGGWRDAMADTKMALAACETKRTKTALSNNAFSATPIDAYKAAYIAKTGGHVLPMEPGKELARFKSHDCHEELTCDQVAEAAGLPRPGRRAPRCYLVLGPIDFVILTNLTPEEYVWYSTHRPGKVFRNVIFTEITPEPRTFMAERTYEEALAALAKDPNKKTKTVYYGAALDRIHFKYWVGFDGKATGGLYCGDRDKVSLYQWPAKIPTAWKRASG